MCSVCKNAPVIVGMRGANPPGHEAAPGCIRVGSVARVAAATPTCSLPACIHDEVGEAGSRPGEVLFDQSTSATVTDELNNNWQLFCNCGRARVSSVDHLASKARKRHVPRVDDMKCGLRWRNPYV